MKNQILFLFLLVFTIACSKSDETPTLQEKVIGEWQINSFVINSCTDESENLPITFSNDEGCLDVMGDTSCMSIHIFKNGKAEVHDSKTDDTQEVNELTYTLDEVNNSIELCDGIEDCITFSMKSDGLFNEMDEDGCICVMGFKKM